MRTPIELDETGVELAIQAFALHWPAFSRWWTDATGRGTQAIDLSSLPEEPFEAALRAYLRATGS